VVRRLETLQSVTPSPGPAGAVTVQRDDLTVAFVEPLKAPLPQPWQPAGVEARIDWAAVNPGSKPDPAHPVYLVVLGTTAAGALFGLNLAAFSRIRIGGDPDTARALVSRWILELLATHPATTVGVTADVWPGPYTTRVRQVAAGQVPDMDVLALGGGLTYAERAQIVATAASPILLDLGEDAAATTAWTITCGPDHHGEISNGRGNTITTTLIIPSSEVVQRCCDLLTGASPDTAPGATSPPGQPDEDRTDQGAGNELAEPAGNELAESDPTTAQPAPTPAGPQLEPAGPLFPPAPVPAASDGDTESPPPPPVDFFTPIAASESSDRSGETSWPAPEPQPQTESAPAPEPESRLLPPNVVAASVNGDAASTGRDGLVLPPVAPIWNRILGTVQLCPPNGGPPGDREKRLNELTVYLQRHMYVTNAEIVDHILGGAAERNTVTQQISLLRSRLGILSSGARALPPMRDGQYYLDKAVRSDWMEFDDLVQVIVERTQTPYLIAAMDLVTGPLMSGISPTEWQWSVDLRDEIRDRVANTARELARRHHDERNFADAVSVARKGLWYDSARQDLWQIALRAALNGHDTSAFRDLRSRYLAEIPGPERDPAVFDLTGRSG
jgi:hypothetical protein